MPTRTRVRNRVKRLAFQYTARRDPLLRLADPANWADPFPVYEQLRARGPAYRSRLSGEHVVTGFDAVSQVLRDTRFRAGEREGTNDPTAGILNNDSLVNLHPPRHTHVRKLIAKGFTVKRIEDLTPWIDDMGHDLLDRVTGQGEFDLVPAVAAPLPIQAISTLLKVPSEHQQQLQDWGVAIGPSLDPFMTPEQTRAARQASADIIEFFRELSEHRRHNLGDDALSALIQAREDGVSLTESELLATCQLMLVAGFGTTVSMITNLVHRLVEDPQLWAELRTSPDLVANAVDEGLRMDAPIQMTRRYALDDVDLEGHPVRAGDRLLVIIGAANRDPAVFADPNRFDVRRETAGRHLSFSPGFHHCVGAALARLEGRLILQAMLDRMPEIRRAGPARSLQTLVVRGMRSVPIQVTPRVLSRTSGVRAG